MQQEEFISRVKNRTDISQSEAVTVTRATLTTLAERLPPPEPHDAASQLPGGIKEYVEIEWAQPEHPFSLDEFYRRVSDRANLDRDQAQTRAQVVIAVLNAGSAKERWKICI